MVSQNIVEFLLKYFYTNKKKVLKKSFCIAEVHVLIWQRLAYCLAFREAQFSMGEVCFCIAEAHGSRVVPPSLQAIIT